MLNLIKLQDALKEIKNSIEEAIKTSGTEGKNNLIRTKKPITLIHDVVKSELIRYGVNENLIFPPLKESKCEISLAGFLKRKNQDICIIPNGLMANEEILGFEGILKGVKDKYGKDFTERTLSINIRSQLSSSAKNFDTLYERTFAEALNLHLRCKRMVLGELYMITVREYDSSEADNKKIEFRSIKGIDKHIEKYLLSFDAVNNRKTIRSEYYKYERVCLLIVDFSKKTPKVYSTDSELKKYNLLPKNSHATIKNLNFSRFVPDLLRIYSERFGINKFS